MHSAENLLELCNSCLVIPKNSIFSCNLQVLLHLLDLLLDDVGRRTLRKLSSWVLTIGADVISFLVIHFNKINIIAIVFWWQINIL